MASPISSLSIPMTQPAGLAGRGAGALGETSGGGFSSMLQTAQNAIGDVASAQSGATQAMQSLALGETDDVVGVMSAVEKGELAFRTLLAIRSKLMAAFDEIRQMPV
jgi:flagellar hook-basal body complex protein FliE